MFRYFVFDRQSSTSIVPKEEVIFASGKSVAKKKHKNGEITVIAETLHYTNIDSIQ